MVSVQQTHNQDIVSFLATQNSACKFSADPLDIFPDGSVSDNLPNMLSSSTCFLPTENNHPNISAVEESCISTVEEPLASRDLLQDNYRPSPVYNPDCESSNSITMTNTVEKSQTSSHVFSTPAHLHYGNNTKQCYSEPVATVSTLPTCNSTNNNSNAVKVWNSRAQFSNSNNKNSNITSHVSKQRVNRSLSYSEGDSLYLSNEHDNSNVSMSNAMAHDKDKKNLSNDGFNMPVKMLLENLPMPSTLPHLTFSPSKPLHETSFSEVKQFLKTPQKLTHSNHHIAVTPLKNQEKPSLQFDNQFLKTPQKVTRTDHQTDHQTAAVAVTPSRNENLPLQLDSQFLRTPERSLKSNVILDVTDVAAFESRVAEVVTSLNTANCDFLDSGTSSANAVPQSSSPINKSNKIPTHKIQTHEIAAGESLTPSTSLDISFVSNSSSHTSKPVENIVINSNQNSPSTSYVNDNRRSELYTPTNDNSDKKNMKPPKPSSANNRKKRFKHKQHRKKKEVFDYEERLKQRALDFADIYLNRVRKTLVDVPELCLQFFALMESVSTCQLTKLQTYYKVAELLIDYPDLVDGFSGFLEQHEARHVGKVSAFFFFFIFFCVFCVGKF